MLWVMLWRRTKIGGPRWRRVLTLYSVSALMLGFMLFLGRDLLNAIPTMMAPAPNSWRGDRRSPSQTQAVAVATTGISGRKEFFCPGHGYGVIEQYDHAKFHVHLQGKKEAGNCARH